MAQTLTVIIPSHRRTQPCLRLLESLMRQDFAGPLEILVIANPPNIDLAQNLKEMRDSLKSSWSLRYLESSVIGVNAARNLGLKQANGEYVLFLDDDCEIAHSHYLAVLIKRFSEYPQASGLGGPYVHHGQGLWGRTYAAIAERWLKSSRTVGPRTSQLIGGNAAYRKSTLLNGFLFNETLRFGGTESELNQRLTEAGHKLFLFEDLAIFHHISMGPWAFVRKAFLQGWGFEFRRKSLVKATRYLPLEPEVSLRGISAWTYYYLFRKGQIHHRLSQIKGGTWFGFYFHFLFLWILQDFRSFSRKPNFSSPRLPLEEAFGRLRLYDPRFGFHLRHDWNDPDSFASEVFFEHLQRANFYGFDGMIIPLEQNHWTAAIHSSGLQTCIHVDLCQWRDNTIEILKNVRPDFLRVSLSSLPKRNVQYASALRQLDIPMWLVWELKNTRELAAEKPLAVSRKIPLAIELRFNDAVSSLRLVRFLKKMSRIPRLSPPIGCPLMDSSLQRDRDLYPLGEILFSSTSPTAAPRISVIIPSYKSEWELNVVLRHLFQQSLPTSVFEILVINDGSPREALEKQRLWFIENAQDVQLRFVHMTRNLPEGKMDAQYRAGIARNLGVALSQGDIVSFLDSDIIVSSDYLSRLLRELEQHDVIQTKRLMLRSEASTPRTLVQNLRRYRDVYPEEAYWEDFKKAPDWMEIFNFWKYTCTYSLTLRKSLFQSAGWFCPTFPNYGFEDTDLGYRLAKMGATFRLSPIEVFHLYPRRQDFNFHIDPERRTVALAHSARIFYSHHLEDRIFREFRWLLVTRDNLMWKAQRLYWRAHRIKGEARLTAVAKYWKTRHGLTMSGIRMFWQAHRFNGDLRVTLIKCGWFFKNALNRLLNAAQEFCTQGLWTLHQVFWDLYEWHWRIRPFIVRFFGKPFFFLAYQYRTRIRPRLESDPSEPHP